MNLTQLHILSYSDFTSEYDYCPDTKSFDSTYLMKLVNTVNVNMSYVYKEIKYVLKNITTDVNKKNDEGWTALMIACGNCNDEIMLKAIKLLIKNGADVNLQNNKKWSALMYVSRNCNNDYKLQCIDLLIKNGADVNFQSVNNYNALLLACFNCNRYCLSVIKILVDSGINIHLQNFNGTGLNSIMILCNNQTQYSVECLNYLLRLGTNPNLQQNKKMSALNICVINMTIYSFDIMKSLINFKANVNLQDINGHSPLTIACIGLNEYSYDCIKLLLEYGSDTSLLLKNGDTALTVLCTRHNKYSYDYVKLMIEYGAATNINDKSLIGACYCGNNKLINLLLEAGSKIDIKNEDEFTPLIAYLTKSVIDKDILEILIERTVNHIMEKNNNNQTAYDIYVEKGYNMLNARYLSLLKGESRVGKVKSARK